jgi:hypothetical protein
MGTGHGRGWRAGCGSHPGRGLRRHTAGVRQRRYAGDGSHRAGRRHADVDDGAHSSQDDDDQAYSDQPHGFRTTRRPLHVRLPLVADELDGDARPAGFRPSWRPRTQSGQRARTQSGQRARTKSWQRARTKSGRRTGFGLRPGWAGRRRSQVGLSDGPIEGLSPARGQRQLRWRGWIPPRAAVAAKLWRSAAEGRSGLRGRPTHAEPEHARLPCETPIALWLRRLRR